MERPDPYKQLEANQTELHSLMRLHVEQLKGLPSSLTDEQEKIFGLGRTDGRLQVQHSLILTLFEAIEGNVITPEQAVRLWELRDEVSRRRII